MKDRFRVKEQLGSPQYPRPHRVLGFRSASAVHLLEGLLGQFRTVRSPIHHPMRLRHHTLSPHENPSEHL